MSIGSFTNILLKVSNLKIKQCTGMPPVIKALSLSHIHQELVLAGSAIAIACCP